MTETVTSTDGTTIAIDRSGTGPTLLIVGGAFSDRRSAAAAVRQLESQFTVVSVDRRGRGDSDDASTPPPYHFEREVEDLSAVIAMLGDEVFVYGHSSGAALALETAAAGAPIAALAVYEPPYTSGGSRAGSDGVAVPDDTSARVRAALEAGDRESAARIFLASTGAPVEAITGSPQWPSMVAVAHTLPYDYELVENGVPTERFARIAVPTLVMDGGASPAWARAVVAEVAASIPGAVRRTLPDQTHALAPAVLAAELAAFFAGR